MLPPALLRATDRLVATLMRLAGAVAAVGNDRTSPADPARAARILLYRLTLLVIRLVRLTNEPLPTPNQTPNQPRHTAPTRPSARPGRDAAFAPSPGVLPRHPGWLLDLLPDATPALAAELSAALADQALIPLLAAAPALARALRPVLHALGLDAPPTSGDPPPRPRPPNHPSPGWVPLPVPGRPHRLAPPARNNPPAPAPSHAQFVPC